jgi:cobaltochelatase CobS
MNKINCDNASLPDITVALKDPLSYGSEMVVSAYSQPDSHVPDNNPDYLFDKQSTLAGFAYNCRVMVSGYHGTVKFTHIEQLASRLNWQSGTKCTSTSEVM